MSKAWRRAGGGAQCTLRDVAAASNLPGELVVTWAVLPGEVGTVRVSAEQAPEYGQVDEADVPVGEGTVTFDGLASGSYRAQVWRLDEGRACAQPSASVDVSD